MSIFGGIHVRLCAYVCLSVCVSFCHFLLVCLFSVISLFYMLLSHLTFHVLMRLSKPRYRSASITSLYCSNLKPFYNTFTPYLLKPKVLLKLGLGLRLELMFSYVYTVR